MVLPPCLVRRSTNIHGWLPNGPTPKASEARSVSHDISCGGQAACALHARRGHARPRPVKMLLLLGQRSTETLEMRWSDLDLNAEIPAWTIPRRFRKGHRLPVVPLAPFTSTILAELRAITGDKTRVFADVSSANAERDWWGVIRTRAMSNGIRERFTRHDLQSTCATGCSRLGAAESTVSRILGHAVIAGTVPVTARYDRFAHLPERAAALKAWAAHVEGLVV